MQWIRNWNAKYFGRIYAPCYAQQFRNKCRSDRKRTGTRIIRKSPHSFVQMDFRMRAHFWLYDSASSSIILCSTTLMRLSFLQRGQYNGKCSNTVSGSILTFVLLRHKGQDSQSALCAKLICSCKISFLRHSCYQHLVFQCWQQYTIPYDKLLTSDCSMRGKCAMPT